MGYDTMAQLTGVSTTTATTATVPSAIGTATTPAGAPTTANPSPAPTPGSTSATVASASNGPAPAVGTGNPSAIASQEATLHGQLSTNGHLTGWFFEYGTSSSYGHSTAQQTISSGSQVPVSYRLTGLTPGWTYHFRLVVKWSDGTVKYGADRGFTVASARSATGAPARARMTSAVTSVVAHLARSGSGRRFVRRGRRGHAKVRGRHGVATHHRQH